MNTLVHDTWAALQRDPRMTPQMRAAKLPKSPRLLGRSVKINKGTKKGILTTVLYLAPATESGRSLCPWATPECVAACLGHSSGQMVFDTSKNARIWKTALFLYARPVFERLLYAEIAAHKRKADRLGMVCAARLNGTSDIVNSALYADHHPDIQFYDYTKSADRARLKAKGGFPPNYHLTFSRSGHNDADCVDILRRGGNVAVVFDRLPETWQGFPVLDADDTDARFTDPAGHVAGLTFKGNKASEAGAFLVRT